MIIKASILMENIVDYKIKIRNSLNSVQDFLYAYYLVIYLIILIFLNLKFNVFLKNLNMKCGLIFTELKLISVGVCNIICTECREHLDLSIV